MSAVEPTEFRSQKYQDIFFNPDDPEAEKQFVFIEANRIAERLVFAKESAVTFIVAELGFGFGLNCALTLAAANQADALTNLQYFSVEENFPEPEQVSALQAKLKICAEEFSELWYPPTSPLTTSVESGGVSFPLVLGERSRVRVHEGDVLSFLQASGFAADAWYFDGFSPAKNPQMWSAEVFALCFAHTKPGGTFSTYSSAGWVRRNLEAAGYVVEKVSGFRNKREMLTGFRPEGGRIEVPVPSSLVGRIEV